MTVRFKSKFTAYAKVNQTFPCDSNFFISQNFVCLTAA